MVASKITFALLTLVSSVLAIPAPDAGAASFAQQNGEDAIALNNGFTTLTADSPCTDGTNACVNGQFAQCAGGKFVLSPCGGGLVCVALPLVNKPGTSITCDTTADRDARIAATGATGAGSSTAADSLQQNNAATTPAASPAASGNSFTKQNGLDAQALNQKFATLSADSPCQPGENACVGDAFAQCVNGKFVLSPCGGGLVCVALPLVNKPGTSITCDTAADRDARIAATGATDAGSSTTADSPQQGNAVTPPAASPATGGKPFTKQNGLDAQALNKKFATLSADSACQPGENACVGDAFAQCVNGKFVTTSCAGGLRCAALPLVNSPGTSITCVDTPQAIQRIAATGAGSSLTGN